MKSLVLISVLCAVLVRGHGFPTAEAPRISGGMDTDISEYPFLAAMLSSGGTVTFTHACGATILSNTALLSAASCYTVDVISGEAQSIDWWRARVGSSSANSGGVLHELRLITIHEAFQPSTLANNIAVLRTSAAITYVSNVVAAATIAGSAYPLPEEQAVTSVGWGITSEDADLSDGLRHVQTWTVLRSMCESRYSELNQVITDSVICSGWLDVGLRGPCQGDEGSPLLHSNVVVGVHSWNQECASHRYPNLDTRVSSFTSWIISQATAL